MINNELSELIMKSMSGQKMTKAELDKLVELGYYSESQRASIDFLYAYRDMKKAINDTLWKEIKVPFVVLVVSSCVLILFGMVLNGLGL